MIKEGSKLPAFKLQDQDGKWLSNNDFATKWVVLYIYPKDDTPGCTIQGKSFTSEKSKFDALNATIVGLSADDVASHKSFCNKFSFTISLLADPQASLLNALGIDQSEYKGVNYWNRTTLIVAPDQTIRKVYTNVNPNGHEQELLIELKRLQAKKV